jgi:hypothetical protein
MSLTATAQCAPLFPPPQLLMSRILDGRENTRTLVTCLLVGYEGNKWDCVGGEADLGEGLLNAAQTAFLEILGCFAALATCLLSFGVYLWVYLGLSGFISGFIVTSGYQSKETTPAYLERKSLYTLPGGGCQGVFSSILNSSRE